MASLKDVQNEISQQGAPWVAGDTTVSRLQIGPGQSLFGLNFTDAEAALLAPANKSALAFKATFRSPAVDWRNNKGHNWITDVRYQGACGSCVSFTVCAVMEAMKRIDTNDANLATDLSEADLFFCGCGNCCVAGWDFVPALTQAQNAGVAAAAAFPYQDHDLPCAQVPKLLYIDNWVPLASAEQRKQHLFDVGPIVAGMHAYEDIKYYKSGVYRHVTGDLLANHAVCIIGYDDNRGCWIGKNSWSTGWGDAGFFQIAYGQCGIDDAVLSYGVTVK